MGNTVPATFWSMYYLVSHPEALQVIRQEIHDVLKLSGVEFSSDRDVTFGREQLEQLVYLGTSVSSEASAQSHLCSIVQVKHEEHV